MRLIAHDEIVSAIGGAEFFLYVLVPRELVEPRNGEVVFQEPIPSSSSLELVVREDLKGKVKSTVELILPLFGKAAGADDQAALEVTSCNQLLDE